MRCYFTRTLHRTLAFKTRIYNNCSHTTFFYCTYKGRPLLKTCNSVFFTNFKDPYQQLCLNSYYFQKYHLYKNYSVAVEAHENVLSTTPHKGKIYFELENAVFHSYLENNPNYCETLHKGNAVLDENEVNEEAFNDIIKVESWTRETAENYFNCFVKTTTYCKKNLRLISDPVLNNLCDAFPSKCVYFSDDQLIRCFICLQNWPDLPGVKEQNFLKVWKALDSVCVMRRMDWDLKKTLYMMDLWYSLKLTRLSEFVMKSILRCIDKAHRLNQHGLVQLMFYLNTVRKVPRAASIYELEHQLGKVIPFLTVEEIGIICAGFFKTQSKIANAGMIDDIILALLKSHEKIDPVSLASISKLVRYAQRDKNVETIKKMFDSLSGITDKYPIQVIMHFVLISETKGISHPLIINNLVEKFLASPSSARIKEMEKISKLLSIFESITGEEADRACKVIMSELESEQRKDEVHKFPRAFFRCLSYLSCKKLFNEKLTSKVLVDDYLLNVYGNKHLIQRELLLLDQNIGFELPDYKGNRLSESLINFLCKKYSLYIPGMFEKRGSPSERLLRDLMLAVRTLSNDTDELWHCTYFLPHFPLADVLIHVGENNQLLDVPVEIKERKYFTGPIKPPTTLGLWLLFVFGSKNSYTSDNQPTGEFLCKIRQLQLLGYTPVLVPYFELIKCLTPEDKLDLIKEKIKFFYKT